jgi:hypothetical protein
VTWGWLICCSERSPVEVLQTVDALFLSRELTGASRVYGVFGLLAWLYLRSYADTERYQPSTQVRPTFDDQSTPPDKS